MSTKVPVKELTTTALLGSILALLGTFKIPGIIPGTEFQLSAPFAVCIAASLGFRRYLGIGILASCINLLMGTHTILNVTVAMVFRIVVGLIITVIGVNPISLIISGPLGTIAGRIVLGGILHTDYKVLILGAVPGMIFTAVVAGLFYPVFERILKHTTCKLECKDKV